MDKDRHGMDYQADTRRRELGNADANEIIKLEQTTEVFYGQRHFWKCYMKNFLAVMKSLSYKQYDVLIYIVENTKPSTNIFIGTYSKIEKKTGCCRQTVATAMKNLQKCNFIRKIQNGVWMINPDILIKGDDNKQTNLREDYENAGLTEKNEEKNGKDDSSKQKEHKEEVCEDSCGKNFPAPEGWDFELELDLDSDSELDSIFDENRLPGRK